MAEKEYDVLIIGSGASGGMAAYALTQKGVKCLVLDAGPLVDFNRQRGLKPVYELPYRGLGKPGKLPHIYQATEFNANQWVDHEQVPYTYSTKVPYSWGRIRMIGGKSNFWGRMSYRLSDYEFKAKDHDGYGDNWPISYAELAPYYDRVEPILRVSGRKEALPQLPDGVFEEDKTPDGAVIERLNKTGAARGMRITKIRRALGDGQLASSANLLLPAAQATGNLTIVSNAVVRAVTMDKQTGKANGVSFFDRQSGRELHAKAKVVVLGASSLESTRILLNSGIANSSGVLGHYWHDQFYIPGGVIGVIPEAKNGKAPRGLIGGSGVIVRFRNLKTREKDFLRGYACDVNPGQTPDPKFFPAWGAELEAQVASHRGAGIGTTIMGETLPRFENHVKLDPKVTDAWGIPVLNFNCRYSDNEHNMARDAVDTISQLFTDSGFEVLHRNPVMNNPGRSMHELGTCRMGDNPKTSVLNRWNQSHDIKNLFVVDGSSFVTGGAQNPTLTIMALAWRASEHLAEQMRKGEL
ncbi:MAG: GMC family oxidoreductase [Acidobacteria bacterium]|nr:GMC family oxidoreductase [Acidobacteriota bacterium]MBI3427449.1 GMC family oxidoreductase [Acidobacteriota bacterium]